MSPETRELVSMMVWLVIGWIAGRRSHQPPKGSDTWLAGWGAGWRSAHYIDDIVADDAPVYRPIEETEADRLIRETGGRP